MVRILLVDDDEAVRAPLARALALDGHAVTEASDGAHALGGGDLVDALVGAGAAVAAGHGVHVVGVELEVGR